MLFVAFGENCCQKATPGAWVPRCPFRRRLAAAAYCFFDSRKIRSTLGMLMPISAAISRCFLPSARSAFTLS